MLKLYSPSGSPRGDADDDQRKGEGEDDGAIESLRKEIEKLKLRLEEERKKLNDVSCEFITRIFSLFLSLIHDVSPFLSS